MLLIGLQTRPTFIEFRVRHDYAGSVIGKGGEGVKQLNAAGFGLKLSDDAEFRYGAIFSLRTPCPNLYFGFELLRNRVLNQCINA